MNLLFVFLISLLCFVPCVVAEANPAPLSLEEVERLALLTHPQANKARLRVNLSREVKKESFSPFLPNVVFNATAVGTSDANTRIGAGSLSNPAIFERNAEGITISQVITDFGRSVNLYGAAKDLWKAETQNENATLNSLLYQADTLFFLALETDEVTHVAAQTVTNRLELLNQVSALASNKLKSDLDLSFAKIGVDEANLLFLNAKSEKDSALLRLNAFIGRPVTDTLQLNYSDVAQASISTNLTELIFIALKENPALKRLRLESESANKTSRAERALHYPTISAVASAGIIPAGDKTFREDYAAAGINLSLPLFAGGQHVARQREAKIREDIAQESLREAETNIVREVKIAWFTANSAHEKEIVTEKLLQHAGQSYNLAKTKYDVGSSSIIEFSQAQLNKTSAEINQKTAHYEYLVKRANLYYQIGVRDSSLLKN
ncbi:MAG: outer rane efflux protein [Verrucomicrobiales bacterium]|nr:outer rane efflux protein [Verrucomicrobiales bacterium]